MGKANETQLSLFLRRVQNFVGGLKVGTVGIGAIVVTILLFGVIYSFSEDKSKGDSKSALFDLFECTPRNGLVVVDPGVIARVRDQLHSGRIVLPANLNDGDTLEVAMPANFWTEKDNDFAFSSLSHIDNPGDPDDLPTDESEEILWALKQAEKRKHLNPHDSYLVKLSRCGGFTVKGYFVENLELATGIRTVQSLSANEVFLTAEREENPLGAFGDSVQDIVEGVVGRNPKKSKFKDDNDNNNHNNNAAGRKLKSIVEPPKKIPGVLHASEFQRTVLAVIIDHTTSHGPKISDVRHIRIILYLLHSRPEFTWMARLKLPESSVAEKKLLRGTVKEFGQTFVASTQQGYPHGVEVGTDDEVVSHDRHVLSLFLDGHAYLGYSKVAFDTASLVLFTHDIDGVAVAFPKDIDRFLNSMYDTRFLDCNLHRAKAFQEQFSSEIAAAQERAISSGRGLSPEDFRTEARQLLAIIHSALDPLGVKWWINSGTLLGWYRQCDVMPYGYDLDIGIPIEYFTEDLVTALSSKGLKLKHRLGLPEWGLEISFVFQKIKLDIFFFYTEGDKMWNGGTQVKSGKKFKYTFPAVDVCYAELLETKVGVPCRPLSHILANYGPDWFTPITTWDWKTSPANVQEAGFYTPEEMKKAVQIFISGP